MKYVKCSGLPQHWILIDWDSRAAAHKCNCPTCNQPELSLKDAERGMVTSDELDTGWTLTEPDEYDEALYQKLKKKLLAVRPNKIVLICATESFISLLSPVLPI